MPELAECMLMADFINDVSSKVPFFFSVQKSEVSKVKTNLTLPFTNFALKAESRGKEVLLTISPQSAEYEPKKLLMNMGMSGSWMLTTSEGKNEIAVHKHAHLQIFGRSKDTNYALCLVDTRRFAKWNWAKGFSENRGPCPVLETEAFQKNFWEKQQDTRYTQQPLVDIIMNQSIFNGIGNYLRAEIFHRGDINPFEKFGSTPKFKLAELIRLCRVVPMEAYSMGGGQMKDWKNGFEIDPTEFREWQKMYQRGESIFDLSTRRFWFEKKWLENDMYKEYMKKVEDMKAKKAKAAEKKLAKPKS